MPAAHRDIWFSSASLPPRPPASLCFALQIGVTTTITTSTITNATTTTTTTATTDALAQTCALRQHARRQPSPTNKPLNSDRRHSTN
ncbi:hypothetical protein E2C01_023272 [Portunus trituberculatus]|uniref:Uncharacterized protein n=1 Tax=Portunus trituberculatus TaxID=210409 RepID=A0A5B7E8D3_PORTR|nr:hypothetical protein [Portunus trituberculatus]